MTGRSVDRARYALREHGAERWRRGRSKTARHRSTRSDWGADAHGASNRRRAPLPRRRVRRSPCTASTRSWLFSEPLRDELTHTLQLFAAELFVGYHLREHAFDRTL